MNFNPNQSLYAISPDSIQPQAISPGSIQPQPIYPPYKHYPPYPYPPYKHYPPYPYPPYPYPYPPTPQYPPTPSWPPYNQGGCLNQWSRVRLRDGRTLNIYVTSISEKSIGGFLPDGRQIALDLNEIVEMTC